MSVPDDLILPELPEAGQEDLPASGGPGMGVGTGCKLLAKAITVNVG
jgi:hypothetical protein